MPPKSRSGVIRQAIGPVRGRLTNNINEADKVVARVINDDEIECETMNDDVCELTDKIKSNIATIEGKDNQWRELILGLDDDDITEEELIYAKTALDPSEGYLTAVERGKEVLCELERKSKELKRRIERIRKETAAASGGSHRGSGGPQHVSVKLPKLTLPSFGGDYCDWPQFWSIFKTNVHDRNISAAEKFAYLLGQLSGPALKSIEGLPVKDDNYNSAVAILRQRFERSDTQMIGTLYSQLKKLPVSTRRVNDLVATFDSCERIFRQLDAVGERTDANRSLVLDLLSKYPGEVVKELMERFNVGPHSTVSEVREALRKYIEQSQCLSEVLEDLTPFSSGDGKPGRSKTLPDRPPSRETEAQKPFVPTSAFTATSPRSGNASNAPQNPCYFCEGLHFNSRCDRYATARQRHERLRSIKRCFRCLSAVHAGEDCRAPDTKIRCFFCKSVGQHVSPLCPKEFKAEAKDDPKAPAGGSGTAGLLNANEQALLLTASAVVCNPITQKQTTARLIFDSGSHRSYVTSACARELKLQELREDNLRVSVFGTKRSLTVASCLVQLQVRERDGNQRSIHLHTTPVITGCPINSANIPSADLSMIQELRGKLADDGSGNAGSIDILIGSDYFWEFIAGSKINTPSGLFFIPSTLGFLVGGRHAEGDDCRFETPTLLCITETLSKIPCESGLLALKSRANPCSPDIDEFWCLERIGISDDPVVNDDDEALSNFNDSVLFYEGRYHVRWPWKKNIGELPNNFELSLGRFSGLARRLKAAPEVLRKYDDVIQDQLAKGVIEKVEERFGQFDSCPNSVHYLPHHPVIKLSSATTKIRIVYDASAKRSKQALSLNECLHRGRVLLPDLCHILIRFRLHRIGIVADVEKAFLQMALQPCDRDVTRFIWFSDPAIPQIDNNLWTYRFCRVPFGIISSPFLLGATIQYHLKSVGTPVASEIVDNIYVDNVISGVDTADEAREFYEEAKQLFDSASMNLQEWSSSSSDFLDDVTSQDRAKTDTVKVLGMVWDCNDDTLRLKATADLSAQTKREVLQAIASVYDPLGLFQPVLLRAKLFLRDLWEKSRGWDDPLETDARDVWENVRAEIMPLFSVRIPRVPFAVTATDDVSVVAFCDASAKAYATAVYLRCRRADSAEWSVNLVYSKSRLTPKKAAKPDVTLPRLELLGLVIGVRAARFVADALLGFQTVPIYVFTDSMCVLHWANSAKPLSVFVENRIREMGQLKVTQVKYVSTDQNPADVSTRGSTAEKLAKNGLWWHGPQWLQRAVDDWPNGPTPCISEAEQRCVDSETRKGGPVLVAGEVHVQRQFVNEQVMGIDITRFSSFRKLIRVTTRCLKFLKLRVWSLMSDDTKLDVNVEIRDILDAISSGAEITSNDLLVARSVWVRAVQRRHFATLSEAIQRGRNHHLLRQLGVKCDDSGILRCHGRLERAGLGDDATAPILLPTTCRFTDLVVRDLHERLLHAGVGHSLSQIRQAFWIPRGRTVVKKVLNRCVVCKKNSGPGFALPDMPPWPKERVARSAPFQYTGLDYFGPINVRIGDNVQKMWVCLFTCLAVRAVHLEWVSDCSAVEFLRALTRFVARRGTPDRIISDNAPQFRVVKTALDKIWSQVLRDESVRSYVANEGIQWKFTTELAPWQGGFYERLVGVVKRSLRVGVGRTMLTWEQLITMVTEVEAIVNSRPITYVYSDFPSISTLRPVDFITDLATGLPSLDATLRARDMGDAGRDLIRYWKYKQGRLDQLWRFWSDEYVLSLRERGQRAHRTSKGALKTFPTLGEVLIVKNTDLPRGAWKLARVTDVIRSSDGEVRSCELILPNGIKVKRPINHLYRLEIDPFADDGNNNNNGAEVVDPDFEGFTEMEADEAMGRVGDARGAARVHIANNLAVTACNFCFP